MAEFTYNNAINASTSYILFEFNYRYYPHVFYEKNLDLCSKLKTAKELSSKLQDLIAAY